MNEVNPKRAERARIVSRLPVSPDARDLFVGREAELGRLVRALDRAIAHDGRLVLLVGEPGIGKTRIARELALRAAALGVAVRWGRCQETEGAPSYWPWVQVLRDHEQRELEAGAGPAAGALAALLADDVPPPLVASEAESTHARFQLFETVAKALRRLCAESPLLVVFDDLHWADAASLLLLRFVATELADARLLVLGTYRDVEMRQGAGAGMLPELARAGERVVLSGLAGADVARLLAARAGRVLPDDVVTTVHQVSEGNPFFVEELARTLEGAPDASPGAVRLPDHTRDVVRYRLRPLSERGRQILEVASVLGRDFEVSPLAAVCGLAADDTLAALDEAARLGLLVAGEAPDAWRFAHALVRETVYGDLPAARRVRLHRAVGEQLEALGPAARTRRLPELAHHFASSASLDRGAKAATYARAAGEQALARLAYEEAAAYFGQAITSISFGDADAGARSRLILQRADALWRANETAAVRAASLEAAELARGVDGALFGEAAMIYAGTITAEIGLPDPTLLGLLEEALTVVPAGAVALRAQLLARLSRALSLNPAAAGRPEQLSEEALRLARASGDALALTRALVARYFAILGPDRIDEALALVDEVVRVGESSGSTPSALDGQFLRIAVLLMLGDVARVDAELAILVPRAERMRLPYQRWLARSVQALRALLGGRFDDAERLAGEALSLAPTLDDLIAPAFFAIQLFHLRREQDRAVEVAPQIALLGEGHTFLRSWRYVMTFLRFVVGEREAAARDLTALATEGFTELPRDGSWLPAMVNLAEVAHGVDDVDSAGQLYDLLRPHAASAAVVAAAVCLGSVERYLGLLAVTLGRLDAAAEHFESALAAHVRLDAPVYRARTAFAYARLLLRRGKPGDEERAAVLLADARATAEALGMAALLREMREEAAVSPVRPTLVPRPVAAELRADRYGWTLVFDRIEVRVPDSKGMLYLAHLLAAPGEHVSAVDLAGIPVGGDAGERLDTRARAAVRQRAKDLEGELAEAERANDLGRMEVIRAELAALTDELARSRGLAGRSRRLGSVAERARVNVT
jgi:tetratricopeptide (TPR) repeat protein